MPALSAANRATLESRYRLTDCGRSDVFNWLNGRLCSVESRVARFETGRNIIQATDNHRSKPCRTASSVSSADGAVAQLTRLAAVVAGGNWRALSAANRATQESRYRSTDCGRSDVFNWLNGRLCSVESGVARFGTGRGIVQAFDNHRSKPCRTASSVSSADGAVAQLTRLAAVVAGGNWRALSAANRATQESRYSSIDSW